MQNPSQKITRSNAIRLFFTDTRFLIDGLPYPDLPMFVDVRTMRHLYLPTEWMIDLATCQARCESPLSWKSYAYDLRGFFEFAIVKGFDWLHPEEMQIGHYGVDLTRQGRSRNHINQVMSTICRFYEWAAERGSITTLALRYETVRLTQHGYFAHIQDKKKLSA
ncbi:MAG TPA: site-specific integrase, partial [Candidatus Dormibacteraeota bacterium]|nr:site-specific integrase [Candidatus Dormibacteraeota bacterium]